MANKKFSFVQRLHSLTRKDHDEAEDFFQQNLDNAETVSLVHADSQKKPSQAPAAESRKKQQKEDQEEEGWLVSEDYEGQLAVDVFQTPKHIIIQSTIAGVRPEDLDISFTNDTITIRGMRKQSTHAADEDYFYRECYWGGFSRSIILPVDVKEEKIDAKMENGILTITIPQGNRAASKTIPVKEIPIWTP